MSYRPGEHRMCVFGVIAVAVCDHQRMGVDEDDGSARSRASAHNGLDGRVSGSVVQAGSITGDVVVGAESGRGSWSELDEWAEGLARAVQAFWHAEEANRQIHDPVALPVRWHAASTALRDHWANIRRRPAESGCGAEPLPLAGRLEQIADVYERIPSRRLVVLGPAGAGKTVLAGRLVLDLLSARRSGQPVPVIVSIGAWNPTTTSLQTWLAEQLIRDHPGLAADAGLGDSSSRAAALVAAERVVPILDAFDEIECGLHEAAVRQFNTRAEIPLVITSREDKYAAAVRGADVVTAAAVVILEELTRQDLAAYLPRTAAGYRTGMWDAVLERMQTQPHEPDAARLRGVLTNPLMVFLARTVYSDLPGQKPTQLLDHGRFPTEQALQEHLLAAFVPAVYRSDRPGPDRTRCRWSAGQARRYLAYLADHLHQGGTRDLAWWQLRDTVPRPRRTLILATTDALTTMLAIAMPYGLSYALRWGLMTLLASGLAVAVTAGMARSVLCKLPRLRTGKTALALGTALITGLTTGSLYDGLMGKHVDAIVYGVMYGTVGGVAAWVAGLRTGGPQPTRTRLQIRGRIQILTARFATGFVLGFMVGGTLGGTLGVSYGLATGGLLLGLAFGLAFALIVGLFAIVGSAFEVPLKADEVTSAAESLARDRGNSLRKMFATVLMVGGAYELTLELLKGVTGGLSSGLADELGDGLLVGWLSVRVTSAWFFWLVLVRGWLPLTGRMPWRIQAFLTDAYERGVLRQAGPIYQFRHATLQDHLTTEAQSPQP